LEEQIEKQYKYFGLTTAEENVARIIERLGDGEKLTGISFKDFKK
jgi:hypothetical protein